MRKRRVGFCLECHGAVSSGGNCHKKGMCPPAKKTAAEVGALAQQAQKMPIPKVEGSSGASTSSSPEGRHNIEIFRRRYR